MPLCVGSEFELGRELFGAYATGGDVSLTVILGAHGRSGDPTKDVDLADVCERIGDCALKELLGRHAKRLARHEILIDLAERGEEAVAVRLPVRRRCFVPFLLPLTLRQSPIV